MAKVNRSKEYQAHLARIERYVAELAALFKGANRQMIEKGLSAGFDGEGLFSFDDFPQIRKKIDQLQKELAENIQTVILNGEVSEWEFSELKNDDLVRDAFGSRAKVEDSRFKRYFARNTAALTAFQQRKTAGMNLSNRIWNLTEQNRKQVELVLDLGIGEGKSAAEIARELQRYLKEPEKLFRRVRDKYGDLFLSKNAAGYHPGQGQYRSSYKNALRLARTEINMAYRTADLERWGELDFVVGYEVRRSNNPYPCDLCETLAGSYPKDFIFTGWHPNCRCSMAPILKTIEEIEADTERILAGEETSADSSRSVDDVPLGFYQWLNKNQNRIKQGNGTLNFLKDNKRYSNV